MSETRCEVRLARPGDVDAAAELAAGLAWSFEFSPDSFRRNCPALLASGDACLLLATRRAAPFYRALGYEESAVYFRNLLTDPVSTRLTSQPASPG